MGARAFAPKGMSNLLEARGGRRSHVGGGGLLKERFLGLLLKMVITLPGVGEPRDPNHASMRNAVSA